MKLKRSLIGLLIFLFGLTPTVHAQSITITDVQGGGFSAKRNANLSAHATAAPLNLTPSAVAAPVITQQPQDQTVSAGSPATFTVSATGANPLTYQWYKNGTPVTGATQAAYTISTTASTDNGAQIAVVVTDVFCTPTTSQNAVLHVNSTQNAPVMTLMKTAIPATAAPGTSVLFTIRYQNTSAVAASNMVITDAVPAGSSLVSGSISTGGVLAGGIITWTIGAVNAGVGGSVSFQVVVN